VSAEASVLTEVSENFSEIYTDANAMTEALKNLVLQDAGETYLAENTQVYALSPIISKDGGDTWSEASEFDIPAKGMTVEVLTKHFLAFGQEIADTYGEISAAYCDSAEQTIIATFRQASPWPVANALKGQIIDRIRFTELAMTSHMLEYLEGECGSLVTAWSECIWDPDEPGEWVRLDNGTTDIDSNDAWEYSVERFIPAIIREIEGAA
jgi:hypothetical protein